MGCVSTLLWKRKPPAGKCEKEWQQDSTERNFSTPAVTARVQLLCGVHSWHSRDQKTKGRMTDRPENVMSEKALKEPTQLNLENKVGLDEILALKEVKIASRKKCSSGKRKQGKAGQAKQGRQSSLQGNSAPQWLWYQVLVMWLQFFPDESQETTHSTLPHYVGNAQGLLATLHSSRVLVSR